MLSIYFVICFLVLYFLPFFVAVDRKHNNKGAILALNLFLGWTMIGWVIAFVWACTNDRKVNTSHTHIKCPECAELVLKEAKKCKHCGCSLPELGDDIKWLKPTSPDSNRFGPAPSR